MRTLCSRTARAGLLLAGLGGLLCAAPPRLGLTAGAAWPTGATRDQVTGSAGYALGAFSDWEQAPGHTLRLALDGSFHPRDSSGGKAQSQALTLNYVFNPRADLQGFSFVVGAGAMNVQRMVGDTLRGTGVKLAWNAGFGVDLSDRWGLLARYHAVSSEGRDLGSVTAGLTYRF